MKTRKLFLTLILFFVISWPSLSFATSGCCSWHRGVSHCDSSVGRQVCNDGSYSPSCTCAKTTIRTSYPDLEEAAKNFTPEKHLASLQERFDTCMDIAKERTTELTSCNTDLQSAKDSISEKDSKISRITNDIDNQNIWLGFTILALIISVAINFYKSRS